MNKTELFLMRRTKKIKLRELAEYMKCSQSLISKWEHGLCNMDVKKVEKYKNFIINYQFNSDN
ncbi:helix-turn-helix transcriptional regulator [Solibacillus sp. FSL R7-0668]|uniref:helix-turn-helix domain-containing protein n=1 Tax=Solibacillus sp. FSL R7-0668 TaxID=2921688 RepID=UPI0030FAAF6C